MEVNYWLLNYHEGLILAQTQISDSFGPSAVLKLVFADVVVDSPCQQ